jgi:hypothetical protein
MWEEDAPVPSDEENHDPANSGPPPEHFAAVSPGAFPQSASLPHMMSVMDLYQAAHARAVADQQLSKLFNPEYYI